MTRYDPYCHPCIFIFPFSIFVYLFGATSICMLQQRNPSCHHAVRRIFKFYHLHDFGAQYLAKVWLTKARCICTPRNHHPTHTWVRVPQGLFKHELGLRIASRENCVGIYGVPSGHIYVGIYGCSLGHIYIHGSIWMFVGPNIEYLSTGCGCTCTYGAPFGHIYIHWSPGLTWYGLPSIDHLASSARAPYLRCCKSESQTRSLPKLKWGEYAGFCVVNTPTNPGPPPEIRRRSAWR